MRAFDVQVNGAGIVGQSLALALARLGLSVALRSAPAAGPGRDDVRAYALNAASIALLSRLKVWESLPDGSTTPVHDMVVRGDAGAAAIEFSAWQQRVGALAVITDAAALEQALATALRFAAHVTPVETDVPATLVAHCEGRAALRLPGLDAGHETFDYGQKAVAARLVASRPHRHVARQWFRSPDILALLPFGRPEAGRSWALVWSLPTARADEVLGLAPAEFERELDAASGGEVGALSLASERASWPLLRSRARRACGPGWVLVGDAAHVVHPLAGQGLNLGLADVAALAETIERCEPWRSAGDERLLRRYVRQRAGPTDAMLRITDGLQGLFAAPDSPLRELRNNGMTLVNRISPLKRWLAARALDS